MSGLGEDFDAKARAAYKHRLTELSEELGEAQRFNDLGRVEKAQQEMDFLTQELRRAMGVRSNSSRRASPVERARVSVTRRIKAAVQTTTKANASLGRYLVTTIKTGTFCSYTPDPQSPVSWEF